jgi:hypothetical protein
MLGGPRQLEEQGLIDAQRIGRIGPLITGDAMTEEDAGRQCHHLASEGRCREAAFAVARGEGQGGKVGLGSSHRRGDAGPALQPRRKARASPAPIAEPYVQPGWLVKPLPKHGAWKGLLHRLHDADDRRRHISAGAIDGRGCAIGCAALSPSALADLPG